MKFSIILSIFYFVYQSLCQLKIHSPPYAQKQLNSTIRFTIANFGNIPYGKTLYNILSVADPEDGCKPFIVKINNFPNMMDFEQAYLIKRGSCSFSQKVRNAQQAGAKLAIIMDNITESSDHITMISDGLTESVQIPSIFISEKDGDQLLSIYRSLDDSIVDNLILTTEFKIYQSEVVQYKLFLSITQKNTRDLLKELLQKRKDIQDQAVMTPYYQFINCFSCAAKNNYQSPQINCLGGGRYCCIDNDNPFMYHDNGRLIAFEQLRQICIFQQINEQGWWNYIEQFINKCQNIKEYANCSQEIINDMQFSQQKIDQCVNNSFDNSTYNDIALMPNNVLNDQENQRLLNRVSFWPSLIINNVSYKGELTGDDIMEAICAATLNLTEKCYDILHLRQPLIIVDPSGEYDYNNQNSKLEGIHKRVKNNDVGIVIAIIVSVLVAILIITLIVYKKIIKRETSNKIDYQVSEIVQNYMKFNELKDEK